MIVDDGIDLTLDTLPNFVKSVFANLEFMPKAIKVTLHTEFIIRCCIAEMETSGDGQVGLANKGKLCNDSLSPWAGMCDKKTCFGGIMDTLSCVDEFTNLKSCGPHSALAASDSGIAIAIIEEFMRNQGTTEPKKAKFDTANVQAAGSGLIDNVEVLNRVSARPEFFQDKHILTSAPDGVYGKLKLYLPCKQQRKFGKKFNIHCRTNYGWRIVLGEKVSSLRGRYQRRIHCEVTKSPVGNPFDAVGLCKMAGKDMI